jgi:hypothetical protein
MYYYAHENATSPTYIRTYIHTYIHTYTHTYLPTYINAFYFHLYITSSDLANKKLATLAEFCPQLASLYDMFSDSPLNVLEEALCDAALDVQKAVEYLILHPNGKSGQSVSVPPTAWAKSNAATHVPEKKTPEWTSVEDLARLLPALAARVPWQRAQQERLLDVSEVLMG